MRLAIPLIVVITIVLSISIVGSETNPKKLDQKILDKISGENKLPVIVILKEKSSEKSTESLLRTKDLEKKRDFKIVSGYSAKLNEKALKWLLEDPNVERIEYDEAEKVFLQDTVPLINATYAHSRTVNGIPLTGKSESICIIDSGINSSHQDLTGRVIAEHCYCTISDYGGGGCCPNSQSEDTNAEDDYGHGTHVAGIAAANGSIKGVAPEANLISLKVIDNTGQAQRSDVISAIEWCTTNSATYNITAISLSLGTTTLYNTYCDAETPTYATAINAAVAKNISVVVATGNDGNKTAIASPACITNSISVSATTKSDGMASYSNRNSITKLLAPGGQSSDINSTEFGSYGYMSGTSMAAPHVSGAIALLQQYKKQEQGFGLTPTQALEAFNNTGKDINDSAAGFVFQRIDAYSALRSIDNKNPSLTIFSPTNTTYTTNTSLSLNFSAEDTNLNATFYNMDNGENITLTTNITFNVTEGSHTLNLFSTDYNNNVNSTSVVFGVELKPVTTLNLPINNSNISSSTATFNCSATSLVVELQNITLLHDINGTFLANQTNTTTGNSNHSVFTVNNVIDGFYTWNCRATNVNNNNASATANWTLRVDTAAPTINTVTISDSYIQNNTNVTITVNATDSGVGVSNVTAEGQLLTLSGGLYAGSVALSKSPVNITATDYLNSVATNVSVTFITDDAAPTVISTYPANASSNIAVNTSIIINFSKGRMNKSSINATSILIKNSIGRSFLPNVTFNSAGNFTTLDPYLVLQFNETYTVNVTTQVKDEAENYFAANYAFQFTTALKDTDNDGNPDYSESDDDNDGVNDLSDFLIGNKSSVNTNLAELSITVNDSANLNQEFNLAQQIKIFNGTILITEFNFTFSPTAIIDLTNLTIITEPEGATAGSVVIYGLTNVSKTVFVKNIRTYTGVCVKDAEISSPSEISANCSSTSEEWISCPGTKSSLACEENGTYWKVSGLMNSGVRQQNDTRYPKITALSTSNSGTSTVTVVLSITTDENSTCKYSTSDAGFDEMIQMETADRRIHTISNSYSSDTSGTYYIKCNDSEGNIMVFSNSTGFSADITDGGSSGGGGGGGGGTVKGKTQYFSKITPGNPFAMVINDAKYDILEISFVVGQEVAKAQIGIQQLDSQPTAANVPGEVYSYTQIDSQNLEPSNLKEAKIKFAVKKGWLTKKGYDKSQISLYRHISGWKKLQTNNIGVTADSYIYEAATPGFSFFAISAEKSLKKEEIAKEKEENKTTGNVSSLPTTFSALTPERKESSFARKVLVATLIFFPLILVGLIVWHEVAKWPFFKKKKK